MKKLGIVASIACALGSVGLGHVYFQRLEAEVSGGPKVAILAAAGDVPVGGTVTEQNLVVRDIPQAYVEARHVRASDVKKVLGARVAAGLKANDALLWSDLAQFSDQHRVLSGLVQNGMRAVAIDVQSRDFDALLRPGDRVDLLFTAGGKEAASSTITLIQNLLVLSVGSNISRADEKSSPSTRSGGGVTLSVTASQAQLITQAKERGRLSLSLRNPDDITLVDGLPETTGADIVRRAESAVVQPTKTAAVKGEIEHVR